jgi:hypothetical protein
MALRLLIRPETDRYHVSTTQFSTSESNPYDGAHRGGFPQRRTLRVGLP